MRNDVPAAPAARPALRVALLGLTVTVTGYALFAAWLLFHLDRYESARERAVATAAGVVVEDGIGDGEDIRVRWTDAAGRTHVQRFAVYETGGYEKGSLFPVAYDPARSDPLGFPTDPDETAAEDDLLVPVLLAGLAAAAVCTVWAWRGLRFRLLIRRPGTALTASVRHGPHGVTEAYWLVVSDEREGRGRWQRVMWHPALDDVTDGVVVAVHGGARWTRAVVVVLPDGSRLVPVGRLRRRPPRRAPLPAGPVARLNLRDAFVLPSGPLPVRPWWCTAVVLAGVGAVLGVLAAVFFADGAPTFTASVGFGLFLATVFPVLWALSAPRSDRAPENRSSSSASVSVEDPLRPPTM
ncbi:hypothetical protein ABZX85_25305 [Streptomyces sp. NPDC004539]|uniref:hypothetical protein n=1 Tax=Streptomyces sp. NPDC004539 TaxID=3154280 RepID=UPI0033BF443D